MASDGRDFPAKVWPMAFWKCRRARKSHKTAPDGQHFGTLVFLLHEKIIAYKGYYTEFMAKLAEQEQRRSNGKSEMDKAVKQKNEYYENK